MKSISIIKEKAAGEQRVILTPREIALLVKAGYNVIVEKGAGENVGIPDKSYAEAGAKIASTKEAWTASKLIIKYKPPVDEEFQYLDKDKVLCAVFHAEGNPGLVKKLLKSKAEVYSYEFFRTKEGVFPLSVASSELAGQIAVIYGAYHLQVHLGGSGKLLAPVVNAQPLKVLVIGYGNAGGAAARLASAMGGEVVVLGTNKEKLRAFQAAMPSGTRCYVNTPDVLEREIRSADLVIGAILISTYDTKPIITEKMVKSMKPGAMIIDVTSGYGPGYIATFDRETSFKEPTFKKYGVLHCKIDTLPLAYPSTTVDAMSQHLFPYLLDLAASVYDPTLVNDTAEAGKIVENGKIVHREVKRHFEHYTK